MDHITFNIFDASIWIVVGHLFLFGYFSVESAFKCFNEARIAAGWWYVVLSIVLSGISFVGFMIGR